MHPLFKYIYLPLAMGLIIILKSCSNPDNFKKKPSLEDNFVKTTQQSLIDRKTQHILTEVNIPNKFQYSSSFSQIIPDEVNQDISKLESKTSTIINKISANPLRNSKSYHNFDNSTNSRYLSINFDNDIFNNTDYYYTNGVNISLVTPFAHSTLISKILLGIKSADINYFGFSLKQNIYTPVNPDKPEVSIGDRPFSAFLTFGNFRHSYGYKKLLSLKSELSLGIIGPASLGGTVQSSIHNIEPIGWENQINNSLAINYEIEIEKGIFSNPHFEINAIAGANMGTVFNKLSGGLYLRFGSFSPVYRGISNKSFQYWIFIKGKSNLVLYDATLQGGIFSNNNKYTLSSSEINTHVFNASIGLAVFYNNIGLELHNFYMTPEFRTAYDFRWGRIKLIFKI
ncbi:MAG: hypothetical protein CMF58_07595 [Lentimicrobiaceae bacterium]|nr:hypothetical protein [Lentimicrobiaceae bacterium]